MASIGMVKEILMELYFNQGYSLEIPAVALHKQIVDSTSHADIGVIQRLIKTMVSIDVIRPLDADGRKYCFGSSAYSYLGVKKPEPEPPIEMPPAPPQAEHIDLGTIDENAAPIESKIEGTRTPEEKLALLKKQYKVE
jgi:hypothetical protein